MWGRRLKGRMMDISSSVMSSATSASLMETTSVNPTRVIPAEAIATSQASATGTAVGQAYHIHDDGTQHCT